MAKRAKGFALLLLSGFHCSGWFQVVTPSLEIEACTLGSRRAVMSGLAAPRASPLSAMS